MLRLHQTFGAHTGRVIELDREVIRLGRLPDNDVAFDPHADLDASGRHAEIRKENGQWVVVDVGSRNGTHVAGRRVTRHVLTSGDEVEFGLGGPRVRVEIVGGALGAVASRHGVHTAAATPVGAMGGPPAAVPDSMTPPVGGAHPAPPPSPFAGHGAAPSAPSSAPPAAPAMTPPPAGAHGLSPAPVGPHGLPGPHGAPPAAEPPPPGGPRYGQRTVGMMIQAAVQQAQQQSGDRSTAFMRAVAVEAAQRSSRGLKIAVALLSVLLVLTLGAVVALFYYARWQEQELRDENVELQRELGALETRGDGETAERRRLEQRLSQLNEELRQNQEADGARIAEQNEQAVYIVLSQRSSGRRDVLCTAFAVRPDVLATTARCVGNVERSMGRNNQSVSIVPNRGQGASLGVRQMWRHPAFVDAAAPSPDVGLIRVDRPVPRHVRLADMNELQTLRTGDDVFVLGFPSQIAGSGAPVAVLATGVVGRMTGFDGNETDPPRRHLISHSAPYDGNAGSPVFDHEGRVVAMNAGNYRTRTRVVDPGTRLSRTVDTETTYAWAVRVDLLLQLLAGLPN
jgi:hypothetical protein